MNAATTEAVAETATHGAEASGKLDIGGLIMHHITDSHEIEVPFTTLKIPLPEIHVGGYDLSITKHVVMMWIATALLLFVATRAARRTADPIPRGWRNVLEAIIVYIRDEIGRKAMGSHIDRYLGYLVTTFFFILFNNLLGLVPGMATATGNVGVTAALAGLAFLMIQGSGIREFGVVKHFKHLVPSGLPFWLLPVMIPVEILGMLAKPFALCIRLFANMTAGHVVILGLISLIFILQTAFAALVSVPFTLFIFILEILVAFIQAYIFTTLVATFMGMSVHPAH